MKRRVFASAASLCVALGTMLAIVLPGTSTAEAGGSTHKITTWTNVGVDVEGAIQGTFKCDSVTGVWKLKLTGIQAYGQTPNGVAAWPDLSMIISLPGPQNLSGLSLKQDATHGLFVLSYTSSGDRDIANPGASCATGQGVLVYGSDSIPILEGTMS